MEYDKNNLIKDFFERTSLNLKQYLDNNEKDSTNYNNEVTMMLNSLLGLLVVAKEKEILDYQAMDIEDIIEKAQYANVNNKKTKKDFFRHMRNSVAHGRFLDDFEIDDEGQIKSLKFLDFDKESKTFEVVLEIGDMHLLIKQLNKIVLGR